MLDNDDDEEEEQTSVGLVLPRVGEKSRRDRPYLIALSGPNVGEMYPVGAETTVGRGANATVRLHDDSISRRHVRIVVEGSSGKPLLEVADGEGGPSMRMLNADGNDVLWLSADRSGAQIATLDDAGDYAAALSAGRTGGRLTLMQKGRGSATLSVDDNGGRLRLTDKDGQQVTGGH